MNQLYYQWAAFVEYLIGEYGREQFDAVYVSGSKSPGSADYAGIYGKDLPTLEQEWQAWLGSIASQDISRIFRQTDDPDNRATLTRIAPTV